VYGPRNEKFAKFVGEYLTDGLRIGNVRHKHSTLASMELRRPEVQNEWSCASQLTKSLEIFCKFFSSMKHEYRRSVSETGYANQRSIYTKSLWNCHLKRLDALDKINKGFLEAPVLDTQDLLRFGRVYIIDTPGGIPVLCNSSRKPCGNLQCTFWECRT